MRHRFPTTAQLLVEDGDARIALDSGSDLNKYVCSPFPDPSIAAFGSSTASAISTDGFAAAELLRQRLYSTSSTVPRAVIYMREINRIRRELVQLCGVADLPNLNIIFAASGTDIHRISAQLSSGTAATPALAIMVDAAETGGRIPAALTGRYCHVCSEHGEIAIEGTPVIDDSAIEVVTVPIRRPDGAARRTVAIDADVESLVIEATTLGRRVLLVLVDVSKTGLIAPSPACALALHRRLPDTVNILVDACQFRLAPPTLRTYLEHGFMVALTGSKFMTGPSFSGALLIPSSAARRLREHSSSRTLQIDSSHATWPYLRTTTESINKATHFGLLLRWEAALHELRVFRSVPDATVVSFLQTFTRAIWDRLAHDPVFEPLPLSPLDRWPLIAAVHWDSLPTIFPFLLCHPEASVSKGPLNREETLRVYRLLPVDLTNHHDASATGLTGEIATLRCQLGQPVACGDRDGVPLSALRLCASARLIVEATSYDGRNASAVIERALAVLDKTALIVSSISRGSLA